MAWGNEVEDGGGIFASERSARSFCCTYRRSGTRFFLIGAPAIHIPSTMPVLTWIPLFMGFAFKKWLRELGESLLAAASALGPESMGGKSGFWHQIEKELVVHRLREEHLDILGDRKELTTW